MSDELQAYRDIFASESAEYVQAIVDGLLQLEGNPDDLEPVEVVFRGAHSLKGMAGAMGYERTADLTHTMESVMDRVRERELVADATLVDLMLRAVDVVKMLITDDMTGTTDVDPATIIAELATRSGQPAPSPFVVEAVARQETEGEPAEALSPEDEGAERVVKVSLEDSCVLKSVRAYMVIKRLSFLGTIIDTRPSATDLEDENFGTYFEVVVRTREAHEAICEAVSAISEVETVEVRAADASSPSQGGTSPVLREIKPMPKLSETQTVRISIGHLDTLVNLVGELVIVRARLENVTALAQPADIRDSLEELGRISSELQHEVMQTRMVPVGNIFNRFPRMVRDLARDLGKDVAFEMDGLDIELDRTVLDEIGDPLVHLLRNALDHGIESGPARIAAGKPARGTVRLAATRERDQARLIVSDDGGGMDPDRIWAKAIERGFAREEMRPSYSVEDIMLLTCLPGFSTSETATKISGRGVGMDVVRGKIERLGGSLSIHSNLGEGSRFVLNLPLTLAIIQALLLRSAGQVFALPLGFVAEVFAAGEAEVGSIEGNPVLALRDGRVVRLHRLDHLVGSAVIDAPALYESDQIVLLEIGDQAYALQVDSLVGRQEIVIKPLADMLKGVKGFGGATVLGDGSVALILDPRTLFSMGE